MTRDVKTVLVATATAAACIVFTMTLARASLLSSERELTIPDQGEVQAAQVAHEELPSRLIIPTLNLTANVQHVGIGQSGNMAVPTNYKDAGWYRYGTVPGYRGSAVIDGHVDNGLGLGAVFHNIDSLVRGDTIVVVAHDGTEQIFEVESVVTYPREAVPLERLFNRTDRPRLNLITCGGDWDAVAKSYDQRVVVYAVLV